MKSLRLLWLIAIVFLPLPQNLARAQSDKAPLTTSRSNLIAAAVAARNATQEVLALHTKQLAEANRKLEELRSLVADGLVARNELLAAERQLTALKEKLLATEQQLAQADQFITKLRDQTEHSKIEAVTGTPANSKVKLTSWRSKGFSGWSLSQIGAIQDFFENRFGRSLPVSTIGQSPTHNQLRWDHRNAADIALHPDSTEGKALLGFLQAQGIPFQAFRGAIPGVSTGPHIHIGLPSNRLL